MLSSKAVHEHDRRFLDSNCRISFLFSHHDRPALHFIKANDTLVSTHRKTWNGT
jgi:hypothetical protein